MKDSKYLINEDPIFFLPSLAVGVGLNEAILLQKIHGWLQCTPKEHVGRNWIYNSYRSWHEQLPFMSETSIKRAIKNLIDKGIIITENFNKNSFDKTLWYSIDYEKLTNLIDNLDVDYRLGQIGPSMVSEWTDNTNNNNNNKENINNINIINTKEKFKKPTLEEVKAYCLERNNNVDAETFYDYFETGGWVDSKGNKVKNWKQKVITWEKNTKKETRYERERRLLEEMAND